MRKHLKGTLLGSALALQVVERASAASSLTPDQCATLYSDLQKFIGQLKSLFTTQPWEPATIQAANGIFKKLCPNFVSYPAGTIYECGVLNSAGNAVISLGVESKFDEFTDTSTAECQSPTATGVVHLTDTQMEALLNAYQP